MNIREIPINFKNAPEPQSMGFREYLSIFLVLLPFMIGTAFFYFVFDHPIFSMFLWMVPVTVIYIFAMSIKLTVLFRFWNIKSFFAGLFKWLFTNVAWGWFIIISWLLGASLILSAVAWDVSNNFMPTVKSVITAINTAHQNNIDEVEAQKTQAAAILKAKADKADQVAADKLAAEDIANAQEIASHVIPSQYWGNWNEKLADCGTGLNDSSLNITAKNLTFYESNGEIDSVANDADGSMAVSVSLSSVEGSKYPAAFHFILKDKNTLIDRDHNLTRYRCGSETKIKNDAPAMIPAPNKSTSNSEIHAEIPPVKKASYVSTPSTDFSKPREEQRKQVLCDENGNCSVVYYDR